jgi:hypothetical protein
MHKNSRIKIKHVYTHAECAQEIVVRPEQTLS